MLTKHPHTLTPLHRPTHISDVVWGINDNADVFFWHEFLLFLDVWETIADGNCRIIWLHWEEGRVKTNNVKVLHVERCEGVRV